ncbi:MAG TPA: hypothetical protein VFD41_05175 [Actinomycetales bacterium]|nr:hypothetical protein [Actinomycetales bacterium]
MRFEVDPAELDAAAERLRHVADQTWLAQAHVENLPASALWAPDLGLQGRVARATDALTAMTRVAALTAAEISANLHAASVGYAETELALSGRERLPE